MLRTIALVTLVSASVMSSSAASLDERVEHLYAENEGVRIHYAALGEGPLAVMIHGFPDFWFTWRDQMEELSTTHRVVAVDQRGYNLSDKPEGVDAYKMRVLVSDIAAVIAAEGAEQAVVIGHDWGGMVAWSTAMFMPDLVERLIILNLPHPNGLGRELASNPQQQENSAYARNFQKPDAHLKLTAERLSGWVKDPEARKRYVEAFERSSFEAMLHYYKANYPREPYQMPAGTAPRVKCSVLMIHGLDDEALLASGLNDTWEWLDADLTLVTIPGAGHFVQQDASEMVTRSIRMWLDR